MSEETIVIPQETVAEESKSLFKKSELKLDERREILRMYLLGHPIEEIQNKFKTTKHAVLAIGAEQSITRTEIEKTLLQTMAVREAFRIGELKDKVISFLSSAVDESAESEVKSNHIPNAIAILNSADRVYRLDSNKPTDISENHNVNVDVAALARELKTDEDKKSFLLNQLSRNQSMND